MSRNLDAEQIETVSSLMDWLHAEIMASHGLAPRASDWRHQLDRRNLQSLGDLDAGPPAIPASHRKRTGRLVEQVRAVLWRLLAPVIETDLASRRLTRAILEDLVADRARLFAEIEKLGSRLEDAEQRIRALETGPGSRA